MPPGIGYRGMQLADILSAPGRPRMSPLRALAASQPTSAASQPTSGGPSKLAEFLATPGLRDALMATSAALLAQRDQPGSLGGALGRALPMGMQAFQQGRRRSEIDEILKNAPPEMQRALRAMDPETALATLVQTMQPQAPPKLAFQRGADGRIYGMHPNTGEQVSVVGPKEAPDDPAGTLPSDLRAVLWSEGVDPQDLTPEQRQVALERYEELKRAGGDTFNLGERDYDRTSDLVASYEDLAEPVRETVTMVNRAITAGDGAIGDQTRIMALNKLLDPNSAVREGEFTRAANAGGLTARAQSLWNQFQKNGRLPESIRRQVDAEIRSMGMQLQRDFQPTMRRYRMLAGRAAVDPEAVVYDPFETMRLEDEDPFGDLDPGGF